MEKVRNIVTREVECMEKCAEKNVERYLCRGVKEVLCGRALKFVSPGLCGVPDRLVLLPGGRIYFVEVKSPGKKLRVLQERICGEIRSMGFTVLLIDSIPAADEFIREVQRDGIQTAQVSGVLHRADCE